MPLPRGKKPAADDNDDSDKDGDPKWDANERNLLVYLLALKRWLPKQHPQFKNCIRYGYIINSRQQTIVFDDNHREELNDGVAIAGTFEDPCIAGLKHHDDSSHDSDASVDSSALTHPPSERKPKDPKTP